MAYSAYAYSDRGYDLSLFEVRGTAVPKHAPTHSKKKRAKNNVVEINAAQYDRKSRKKQGILRRAVAIAMAAVAVLFVGIMLHGQAQLAELNQEITQAQTELAHKESEYTQMRAKVEASLSTAVVEEYARTQLGMTKATNQQKEYITLSHGDKAEVFTKGSDNVFSAIGDFFGSLWS